MRMSGGHSKASRAASASDPSRPLERTGSAFAAPEPSASPASRPKLPVLRPRRFGAAPNHRHYQRNPHRAGASPSRREERNCPYSFETAPGKPCADSHSAQWCDECASLRSAAGHPAAELQSAHTSRYPTTKASLKPAAAALKEDSGIRMSGSLLRSQPHIPDGLKGEDAP